MSIGRKEKKISKFVILFSTYLYNSFDIYFNFMINIKCNMHKFGRQHILWFLSQLYRINEENDKTGFFASNDSYKGNCFIFTSNKNVTEMKKCQDDINYSASFWKELWLLLILFEVFEVSNNRWYSISSALSVIWKCARLKAQFKITRSSQRSMN